MPLMCISFFVFKKKTVSLIQWATEVGLEDSEAKKLFLCKRRTKDPKHGNQPIRGMECQGLKMH